MAAHIVTECPRCHSTMITLEVISSTELDESDLTFECACVCRHCRRMSVFNILSTEGASALFGAIHNGKALIPPRFRIMFPVKVGFFKDIPAPAGCPDCVSAAFQEASRCLDVDCFNASATMFRLTVDFATRTLLPDALQADEITVPSRRQRENLYERLKWLFKSGRLGADLHELADCIREDGNDGAHDGTLTKNDAEDLRDFATALLARIFTQPAQIAAAKARRDARRQGS